MSASTAVAIRRGRWPSPSSVVHSAGVVLGQVPLVRAAVTYRPEYLRRDLVAAVTVAVVAIPQSMAYALIAGVDVRYGLYTAVVGTIVAAAFGSSSHVIAGPTNAIAMLVAANMAPFAGSTGFYEALWTMTLTVGLLQIGFGLLRLGKLVNYVSHAVVVGFTAGAGILIAANQLSQLLGIAITGSAQLTTLEKLQRTVTGLDRVNWYALGLGLLTILVITGCRRISRQLPGALIGLALTAALALVFRLDARGVVLTGAIPSALPAPGLFSPHLETFRVTFGGAAAIAVIGLVEAMAIAKSIAATSRERIDADQEFVAQGTANTAAAFFQCFPGSGSFTRSAINYHTGAATRFAGMLSGAIVGLVIVAFAPYARYIPMPALAGVIMVTAYGMVNRDEIGKVYQVGRSDSRVMWVTFGATILMPDLDWAIYAGIAISVALFLKDTATVGVQALLPEEDASGRLLRFRECDRDRVPTGPPILILQLVGNLYFGSACDLEGKLETVSGTARVLVIRLKRVIVADITSLEVLGRFVRHARVAGRQVVLCGVSPALRGVLEKARIAEIVGAGNLFCGEEEIFASTTKAYARARELLAAEALPTAATSSSR